MQFIVTVAAWFHLRHQINRVALPRARHERILNVFDGWVLVWWPGDEDQVEADGAIG